MEFRDPTPEEINDPVRSPSGGHWLQFLDALQSGPKVINVNRYMISSAAYYHGRRVTIHALPSGEMLVKLREPDVR